MRKTGNMSNNFCCRIKKKYLFGRSRTLARLSSVIARSPAFGGTTKQSDSAGSHDASRRIASLARPSDVPGRALKAKSDARNDTICRLFLAASVLFLSGCAILSPWTQLRNAEYKDGARDFAAVVPVGWMRFNLPAYFIMTKDGTVLDKIVVDRRKFNSKLEFTKKVYTKDMVPQDLAEVEIDNLRASGQFSRVEVLSNTPATIGGQEGFRIEYTYVVTNGGLRMQGIHYGFRYKDWIYRVYYEASKQHYFEKSRKDFERFVESFRLL